MKKILFLFSIVALLSQAISCSSSQTYLDKNTVSQLVADKTFTFMAQRANPLSMDVSKVMSAIPGAVASQVINLDYGYTVVVNKDKLTVNLPFYGRAYNAPMDPSKNGYSFSSENFTYISKPGKKNSTMLTFYINDKPFIQKMYLQIYQNGKAYLSIDSNDRQPISYDGYIMKNAANTDKN
ncbi:DUF4251 domain-containing protein [Weeksellaceae bacterium A-14]